MTTDPGGVPGGVRIDPRTLRWVGSTRPGCFLGFTPVGAVDLAALVPRLWTIINAKGLGEEGDGRIRVSAVVEGEGVLYLQITYDAARPVTIQRWVDQLAAAMTEDGLVGLLHRQLPQYPPPWVSEAHVTGRGISVMYAGRAPLGADHVRRLATAHGVERLPVHSLSLGSEFQARVVWSDDLHDTLAGLGSATLNGWDDRSGRAAAVHRSQFTTDGWNYGGGEGDVVRAREALLSLATDVDQAFAEASRGRTGWQFTRSWPADGIDGTAFVQHRDLWPRRVIDAHGLQILTAEHLALAHDLSEWRTSKVGDRYLVEARDLDGWLAPDEPDAQLLAAARTAFSAMIITRVELDEIRAAIRQERIREYQERLARGEA